MDIFISGYAFTPLPNVMLYFKDDIGDENIRIYKIDTTVSDSLIILTGSQKFLLQNRRATMMIFR